MEYTFYSNHSLKIKDGKVSEIIDKVEYKIVVNFLNSETCSLFVYNIYTSPHELIRGIKQAKIIIQNESLIELEGYGMSTNGIPIDDLYSKIIIENNQIVSVEYIKSSNNASILHQKRVKENSDFFFELLKFQDVKVEDPLDYVIALGDIYQLFFDDFNFIDVSPYNNEFSICCNFLLALSRNSVVRQDHDIYLKTCNIAFYCFHKTSHLKKDNLIDLLNKNCEMFIYGIIMQLVRVEDKSVFELPFKYDDEFNRAKKIFFLMESWILFLPDNEYSIIKWKEVIASNKNLFERNTFAPYNLNNALNTITKLYDAYYESVLQLGRK